MSRQRKNGRAQGRRILRNYEDKTEGKLNTETAVAMVVVLNSEKFEISFE